MDETDPTHVVVVDPDPSVGRALSQVFADAPEAVQVSQKRAVAEVEWDDLDRTDCVVCEYDLPDSDGLTLLSDLREAIPEIPVVLYTNAGGEAVASEAIAAGVTDYVSKETAGPDVLANRIEHAVIEARAEARTEQIERVNQVLQSVTAALVRADTRQEIEQSVCDIVAESDQYRFAWVGEYVPSHHRLLPRAHAGMGESFLEQIPVGEDSTLPDRGPGPETIETGAVQVTQNIDRDESFEDFQDVADAHGYRSVATVPLAHEDTMYGLLALYADRPQAFDETEQDLLASLGHDIGHAIHAVEMQAELREFRKAFEHGGHAMCITEPGGQIEHVNDAFVEQTGFARETLLGASFSEIQSASPEEVPGESGRVADRDYWERELTATRADGTQYHVEQTIAPIQNEQGSLQGFVVIQADVTDRREREVEIRREREMLDSVFETSPTGILVLDPDGDIVRANNRAEEILALEDSTRHDLRFDEPDWNFTDAGGEPVPPQEHPFRQVLADQAPMYDRELRMERPGAAPIWLTINGAPLFAPDGSLERVIFTLNDITESKTTQRELEETNRTLETLIQAAPVAIIAQNLDGEVTLWSEGAREIFGWTEAEVLGMERPPLVGEDDVDEYESLFHRTIQGESFTGVEIERQRKDGQTLDLHLSAAPIHDADGYVRGAMAVLADLTDQKERERQLRQFRQAVEHAGHSVIITDRDGTIQYVNPTFEEQTGYSADEAIGRSPAILKSDEYDESYFESMWETILDGEVWEHEIVNERKDGSPIHVDQTIAPVYGDSGEIEHFVAVNRDITDRKENELALERQNTRLEEFARVVSHDLRNPLTVAQGSLDLLEGEEGDHKRLEESLDRMEAIIDDVLTLAREGDTVDSVEPLAITALARDSVGTVDLSTEQLRIEGEPTMTGDPKRTRRIFENLYRNALEHVGEEVTVTVGPLDAGFYVADDGPGIESADRERVFESGYTTDSTGTGLGLAIVRRLAEAQGWTVTIATGNPSGARFEFRPADDAI